MDFTNSYHTLELSRPINFINLTWLHLCSLHVFVAAFEEYLKTVYLIAYSII